MSTRFIRDAAPLRMLTAAFTTPKWSATSAINSALALPSTGGDLSRASYSSSLTAVSALTRERNFTLTAIVSAKAPSASHL